MRLAFLALAALVLTVEASAQTALIGQRDTARPGGVYTRLTADDAASCAQLCAEDGICLAWTYRAEPARECELKAVTPSPVAERGATSGLSSRAPAFAIRIATQSIEPLPPGAAPAQSAPTQTGGPVSLLVHPLPEPDLLGAPDADADAGLRARLDDDALR